MNARIYELMDGFNEKPSRTTGRSRRDIFEANGVDEISDNSLILPINVSYGSCLLYTSNLKRNFISIIKPSENVLLTG